MLQSQKHVIRDSRGLAREASASLRAKGSSQDALGYRFRTPIPVCFSVCLFSGRFYCVVFKMSFQLNSVDLNGKWPCRRLHSLLQVFVFHLPNLNSVHTCPLLPFPSDCFTRGCPTDKLSLTTGFDLVSPHLTGLSKPLFPKYFIN